MELRSASVQPACSSFALLDISNNIHHTTFMDNCGGSGQYRGRPSSCPPPGVDFSRKWEDFKLSNAHRRLKNSNAKKIPLVVLSYNILAQTLLENHSNLYQGSPTAALNWEYRFQRIFEEISLLNPDFACLQEVQATHLSDISKKFKTMGYSGIYKQRTGIREDGCAIFYKAKLFEMLKNESVEFRQPNSSILNRDNIGLMGKFISKKMPNLPFVICTTHLLYNPRRNDVRQAQMQVFLAEMDRFSFIKNGDNSFHLPIILTGDFNSPPDSLLNQLIYRGSVESYHSHGESMKDLAITSSCQHLGVYLERANQIPTTDDTRLSQLYHSENKNAKKDSYIDHTRSSKAHLFDNNFVRHNFSFNSVYNHIRNGDNEATTFQDEWLTVDYIYYSSNAKNWKMYLTSRLELPTSSEAYRHIGHIPNYNYGSDHLSLCAKFTLYNIDNVQN